MIIKKVVYYRGGSWYNGGNFCRVDSQYNYDANDSYDNLCLRICRRIV